VRPRAAALDMACADACPCDVRKISGPTSRRVPSAVWLAYGVLDAWAARAGWRVLKPTHTSMSVGSEAANATRVCRGCQIGLAKGLCFSAKPLQLPYRAAGQAEGRWWWLNHSANWDTSATICRVARKSGTCQC
jgi:hypothetical protein